MSRFTYCATLLAILLLACDTAVVFAQDDAFSNTRTANKEQGPQVNPLAKPEAEVAAYSRIQSERNVETKKNLVLAFEKNFPRSKHLPELYIDRSRTLVSQSDFTSAVQCAEKALNAVAVVRNDAPGLDKDNPQWQNWINGLETSAKINLAWTKQMLNWQQQQVRQGVAPRR